jgi:hypothetical protein
MQVIINGRRMPTPERLWQGVTRFAQTAATMRTVALLLASICLSVAIVLAMLIAALAPASVAAPSPTQLAPRDACAVAVVWPGHLVTSATCPLTTLSAKCCARPFLG